MSRPSNSAIHGYSIDEVYKAIEEHLVSQGFDFSKKKFDATFDKKVVADIKTGSGKLGVGRGMYVIHPNLNNETGEYWSAVTYNTFAANGVGQSWSFAEHYKQNKEERLRSGKVEPQKITPERQAEIDREARNTLLAQQREEALKELNATAAVVLTKFDYARASDVHVFRNYKNHVNNYPYIRHKGFSHAYGAKFLPTTAINIKDLKVFVDQNFSDKYPEPKERQALVTAVLDLEDKFINMSEKENSKSRRDFAQLMLPLINVHNEVTSAQLLNGYYNKNDKEPDVFGRKKLVSMKAMLSNGVIKGSFQAINSTGKPEDSQFNPNKKIYTLAEGWATSITLSQLAEQAYPNSQHQMQHLFGVNTLNLAEIAQRILEVNKDALVLIGYDNDASKLHEKLGVNAGIETGCRAFSEIGPFASPEIQKNIRTIIPPVLKTDKGISDWNDVVVGKGMGQAVEMFKTVMADAADRRKNNVNEYQFLVDIYDAQRQDFFNSLSKEDENEYRNPGEKSKLKGPYVVNFSTFIAEKVEDAKFRQNYENSQQNDSVANSALGQPQSRGNSSYQKAVLPKDMPLDKDLGFQYDLNRPVVNVQTSANDTSVSLLASLMQSVDMNAVRKSGMNLVDGANLTDGFVREESKQSTLAIEQSGLVADLESKEEPVIRAETFKEKIQTHMPVIDADTVAKYERQPIESAPKNVSAQDRADNLDHRKSELFTAFWLYQSEIHRAKEIIAQAEVMPDQAPVQDKVRELSGIDKEFLIHKNTISQSFALVATDPDLRDKLITDLQDIVNNNPQWENLGRFTTFINDHVIAMDDAQRQNMLLQNNAVTKIIANIGSGQEYAPETIQAISEALKDTSNLATSRIGRQSLYGEVVSALYHADQEPEWVKTAIEDCNNYMNRSLSRLEKEKSQLAVQQPPQAASSGPSMGI